MIAIREPLLRELQEHAARGYPHEVCGLLVGQPGVEVTQVVKTRNLNTERPRDRYEVHPADFLAAEQAASAEGLEVVGVWHTHPDHGARPSETDRAEAWEGFSYVIAAVGENGVTELRSWRLTEERFVEEEIRSTEPGSSPHT